MPVARGIATRLVMRKKPEVYPKWYNTSGRVVIWQHTDKTIFDHSFCIAHLNAGWITLLPAIKFLRELLHVGSSIDIPSTAVYESWNPIVNICNGAIIPISIADSAIASHFPVFRNVLCAILYMRIINEARVTEGEKPVAAE